MRAQEHREQSRGSQPAAEEPRVGGKENEKFPERVVEAVRPCRPGEHPMASREPQSIRDAKHFPNAAEMDPQMEQGLKVHSREEVPRRPQERPKDVERYPEKKEAVHDARVSVEAHHYGR